MLQFQSNDICRNDGGMENAQKAFSISEWNSHLHVYIAWVDGCMHVKENFLLYHSFFDVAEQKI